MFTFPDTHFENSVINITSTVFEDLSNEDEKLFDDSRGDILERRCLIDLKDNLAKLQKEDKFADLTLECECKCTLKAHKCILASRSRVFERMFSANMLEAKTNVVQCKFDVGTMRALLDYIYSGKLDQSKVYSLFEAADYYEIQQLKDTIEEILTTKLNSQNAVSGLILAHTFGRKKLMRRILNFIPRNSKAVVDSDGYKKACKDCSPKMLEIAFLIINALVKRY